VPRRLLALALIATAAVEPLGAVAAGWDWYLDGAPIILLAVAGGYAAGAWLPRLVALVAVLAATTALVIANQTHDVVYHWLDDSVFFLVVVGGAAAAGAAVTTRAQQVRRLERLQAELDEQQRVDVAAARLDEQNQIHHEVHTRLAERIAGIAVRAEGARRSGDDAALRVIETEARGVLDQLRGALGSMRSEQPEAAPEQPAERRPRPSALDIALAVAIGGALAVETAVVAHARGPLWANVMAAFVTTAPLVLRRGWPILSSAASLAFGCAMSFWLTPVPATVTGDALLAVIFYSIGAWCGRWWWIVGWAIAAAGSVAAEVVVSGLADDAEDGDGLWIVLIWTVGAVALGRITAGWQARVRRTASVVDELRRGRGAAVRLATAREREALAGELHDTVAHAMTVVCLHSGASRRVSGDATGALQTISVTAEASLAELRDGIDAFESVDHPLEPSRIAAVGRRMGVDVALVGAEVNGAAAVLGYRVVREAIVNIARHAPGASATVTVQRNNGIVSIEIADSGSTNAPASVGTGTGLTGLARAVETAGGTLAWGAHPGGGVRGALPRSRHGDRRVRPRPVVLPLQRDGPGVLRRPPVLGGRDA
jgi:signal transduction histidine kinase